MCFYGRALASLETARVIRALKIATSADYRFPDFEYKKNTVPGFIFATSADYTMEVAAVFMGSLILPLYILCWTHLFMSHSLVQFACHMFLLVVHGTVITLLRCTHDVHPFHVRRVGAVAHAA